METRIRESVQDVASVAQGAMGTLKSKLDQGKEAATEYASQAKGFAENKIRTYPFWATLLTFGVGISVGVLATTLYRRRRKI